MTIDRVLIPPRPRPVRVRGCTCGAYGMPPGPHEPRCGWEWDDSDDGPDVDDGLPDEDGDS